MQMKPLSLLPPKEENKPAQNKPIVRKTKTETRTQTLKTTATTGRQKLSLTLEDGMIVIRMPVAKAPTKSTSGKSLLYGTTRGPRRVLQEVDGKFEPVMINDRPLKAIASAFAAIEDTTNSKN